MVRQAYNLQSDSPPRCFQYPPGTIHSRYNVIVCAPYALRPHDCSVTSNFYFLIPSPFVTQPPAPSPLAAVSLFSVPVSLTQMLSECNTLLGN